MPSKRLDLPDTPILAVLAEGEGGQEANRRRYCGECDDWVHARPRPVRHGLHLAISLFLFPPWIITWTILALLPSLACPQCEGHTTPGRGIWRLFNTVTVALAVNGACLLLLLGIGHWNRSPYYLRESQLDRFAVQLRNKDYEAGVDVLNEMLARDAEDIEALALRGDSYKHLNNHAAAIADYTKVIELAKARNQSDMLPDAYHQRAHAYEALEKNDLAYEDFSRAAELEPDRHEFRKCRANFCLRINKLDEAHAEYSAAIRLDNKDAESYYWRATILLRRDELRAALADLRQACELTRYKDPDYVKLLEEAEEYSADKEASPGADPSIL